MILDERHMWFRSSLPVGGSPSGDRAYLRWRDEFVSRANARFLDRCVLARKSLPTRELVELWQLDEWLFVESGGTRLFESPNYAHRLRHLAIALASHPRTFQKLAAQYVAIRMAVESTSSEDSR